MMYLGFDPGITGAMALYDLDTDTVCGVWDMPIQERMYGKGQEIDWGELVCIIDDILGANGMFANMGETEVHAVIEFVGVMPRQGITSAFAFGQVVGGIRSMCAALNLEVTYVHPTAWKRRFGLVGTKKEAVSEMLKNTYSETADWLTLKKHHNRADAIAIAIAGSRA